MVRLAQLGARRCPHASRFVRCAVNNKLFALLPTHNGRLQPAVPTSTPTDCSRLVGDVGGAPIVRERDRMRTGAGDDLMLPFVAVGGEEHDLAVVHVGHPEVIVGAVLGHAGRVKPTCPGTSSRNAAEECSRPAVRSGRRARDFALFSVPIQVRVTVSDGSDPRGHRCRVGILLAEHLACLGSGRSEFTLASGSRTRGTFSNFAERRIAKRDSASRGGPRRRGSERRSMGSNALGYGRIRPGYGSRNVMLGKSLNGSLAARRYALCLRAPCVLGSRSFRACPPRKPDPRHNLAAPSAFQWRRDGEHRPASC